MSTRFVVAAVCSGLLFACAIDPGVEAEQHTLEQAQNEDPSCTDQGWQVRGPTGPSGAYGSAGESGPTGPLPFVDAGGGLLGDGVSTPLAIDPSVVASVEEAGGFFEVEDGAAASQRTAESTASAGSIAVVPSAFSPGGDGVLWSVTRTAAQGLLARAGVRLRLRAKVSNNVGNAVLFQLGCKRVRDEGSLVTTTSRLDVAQASFGAPDTWQEIVHHCPFAPDDVEQTFEIRGWVSGLTTLSLDSVHVRPVPRRFALNRIETYNVAHGATTGDAYCGNLGGVCIAARVSVDVRDTVNGSCGGTSVGFMRLDDCGRTLAASSCTTTSKPNLRGVTTDVVTTGGPLPQLLCLLPQL